MRKPLKKPIKVRRKWAINPRTRVKKDETLYKRAKEKRKTKRLYEER